MLALFLLFYVAYVAQNSYKDDAACIYTSQQVLYIPVWLTELLSLTNLQTWLNKELFH